MTAQAKALEFYLKAMEISNGFLFNESLSKQENYDLKDIMAKNISLLIVDEILNHMEVEDKDSDTCHNANSKWTPFWLDVKREINKT